MVKWYGSHVLKHSAVWARHAILHPFQRLFNVLSCYRHHKFSLWRPHRPRTPIVRNRRLLEKTSPECFLRLHRQLGWRILPGTRDDILGTAGSVLNVLLLKPGILSPAPDTRSLVGPSALPCLIFQMLSDFSSKVQRKGQSPDVKYASAKLNHQGKQTRPIPVAAV